MRESDSASKPARRRRRRRWLWLVVALVVATAAAAALRELDRRLDPWTKKTLETELARRLGGDVRIDDLHVRPFRLQVEFRGFRWDSPGEAGLSVHGSIARGLVRLSWTGLPALPAGRVRFAEIDVDAPVLTFVGEPPEGGGAGPSRPIDWRIDRLTVSNGEVSYEKTRIPIRLAAEDVDLRGEWSRYRRALSGRLGMTIELERAPLVRPYVLRMQSGFRLSTSRVELFDLDLVAPGIGVDSLAGHVLLDSGLPMHVNGRFEADVESLASWLEDPPEVGGRVLGDLTLDRFAETWSVGGRIEMEGGRLEGLSAGSVEARFDLSPDELALTDLRASAYGGSVRGAGRIALTEPYDLRAEIDGRGLDVPRLAGVVGARLPVSASLNVALEFEGEPERPRSWRGKGRFSAEPGDEAGDGLAVSAQGSFEIAEGRLTAESATLSGGGADFDLASELDLTQRPPVGEMRLMGEVASLERSRLALLRFLEDIGTSTPELLEDPVTGAGRISARIGVGRAPDADVTLELRDGVWEGVAFDSADADLGVRRGRLDIRRFHLAGPDWTLDLSGQLGLDEGRILELEARATDVPLDPLEVVLPFPVDLEGRVSGAAGMREGDRGLEGSGTLTVGALRAAGEPLGELRADFTAHRDVMDLHDVRLEGPGLAFRGGILLDLESGVFEGRLAEGRAKLAELRVLRKRGIEIDGMALASGAFRFSPAERFQGEFQVSGPDWEAYGFDLGVVEGDVRFETEGADFRIATGGEHGLSAEGHVGWSEGFPVTAVLYLDGTTLETGSAPGEPGAWARLSGHVLLEGPLSRPEALVANGSIRAVDLRVGTRSLEATDEIRVRFKDGTASIGPATLRGPDSEIEIEGRLDVIERGVDVRCTGTLDLGVIAAQWPELRAAGPLRLDLSVGGTWESLELEGRLDVEHGRARLLGFPEPFDEVSASLVIQGQSARLESLQAVVGGGEITGAGAIAFDGLALHRYVLDLDVAGVRVRLPEGFKGAYDGRLKLEGGGAEATLSGDLVLLRGLYDKEFNLPALLGYRMRDYASDEDLELPVRLFLDVDLTSDGDLWVRNRMFDLENRISLHFGGEVQRPEITGRVWIVEGGEVEFRSVEYRIQSGSLDLLELQRINPYVEIRAETDIGDYDVFLHVQGTLDNLEYELSSDPVLSPEDIISLLATGRTLEELTTTTGAGGFTGDVVANYFASALTQPFEQQLERVLGLEHIRIDPFLVEGEQDPTTRITVGKDASDTVRLLYSTDLNTTENDLYQVQWKASRKLRMIAEKSTAGGVGGSVRYTTRFWIRDPAAGAAIEPPQEPALSPAADPDVGTLGSVDAVRIEGVPPEIAEQLLERIPFGTGDTPQRSRILQGAQQIRAYFVGEDHIEARVQSSRVESGAESGAQIVYRVDRGPKVDVGFEGIKGRHARRLRSRLRNLWIGSIFQDDLYRDGEEIVLAYLHGRGYYAADVRLVERFVEDVKEVRFLVDAGPAVKVASIELAGVKQLPDETVRRQLLTRSEGAFSKNLLVPSVLDEDLGAIRNLYREHGFLRVEVEPPQVRLSPDGARADVKITLHEGPRFNVSRVSAPAGLPFPSSDLVEWGGLEAGDVFGPSRALQAESALRLALDRRGYPDARVGTRLEIFDDHVAVDYEIETGPLKRIGEIEIRGNRKTKRRIIERELLMEPGDLISRDGLLQVQHRLYRLGIFRNVRVYLESMEGADPTLHRVRVDVEEGPPVRISVGVGYDTEESVRGSFSISQSNLLGRNRRLGFQASASSVERRLQVLAQEPRLFGRRDLEGLANVLWEDTENVSFDEERRAIGLRVGQELRKKLGHYVRYAYQNVDLTNVLDTEAIQRQKLEDVELGDVAYGLLWSTLDDQFSPTRGKTAFGEVRVFSPAFGGEESFLKLFLQGSWMKTFRNKTQFVSAARFGMAWPFSDTDEISLSERFFAGGSSTLRGFEVDSVGPRDPITGVPIGGQSVILLNGEFRYPVWRALKGNLFYDLGNVWETVGGANGMDLTDLRHVLGLGFRVETPVGPIRIEYGRKLDQEEGESSGEFYLSIGNAF